MNFKTRTVLTLILVLFPLISIYGQSGYKTEFVTVAGKKMAYKASGLSNRKKGEPVIVFEGGGGSGKETFELYFLPALSKDMAWVMYDRAGLSESEPDPDLKTDMQVVQRLHDFLSANKIPPPYLLVGHSLGGPFIRLFTSLYPKEVAGLLFIDPTNFMLTQQEDEQIKKDSGSKMGYIDLFINMHKMLASDTSLYLGVRNESKRIADNFRKGYFHEYASLAPLPDIPVTVLIAYNSPIEHSEKELARKFGINLLGWFEQVNKYRIQQYSQMIKNNNNSSIVLLPGYQHVIHHRDPPLVAAIIADVYKKCLKTKP